MPNTAPVAVADSYSTHHGTTLTINAASGLLINDTDADSDPLSVPLTSVTTPEHGSVGVNNDGAFVYIPNSGYVGSDSFQYRANDGTVDGNLATVTINVTNTAPSASGNSYTVTESPLTVSVPGVLGNDSDPNGDTLTAVLVSDVSAGVLNLNSNGSFSYSPGMYFTGSDSFTYKASDGAAYSSIVTVTLTNHAPTAGGVSTSTNEDTAKTITLSGSDVETVELSFAIVAGPSNGTLNSLSNNSGAGGSPNTDSATVVYTPHGHFFGTDSFTYNVGDGLMSSSTVTVSITVNAVNDVPSFTKGSDQWVYEDAGAQSVNPWASALSTGSANESQTLNFIVSNSNNALFSTQPALSASGALTYTPAANAHGSATVTVQIHDDGGTANGGVDTSAAETFTITVYSVNDVPTASDFSTSTNEDTPKSITLYGSDVETTELSFTIVSGPSWGSLGLLSNNSGSSGTPNSDTATVVYTPNPNFNGMDSFTYRVNDGTDDSSTATVTIIVNPINDLPFANALNTSTNEDTPTLLGLGGTDVETVELSFFVLTSPSHGTLNVIVDETGSSGTPNTDSAAVLYTPDPGYVGPDSFTYAVHDGADSSSPATVSINVLSHPTVTVVATDPTAGEANPANTGQFTLTRRNGTNALTVLYSLSGGALSGTDYTAAPAADSVTFNPGQTTVTVTITPVDDALVEGVETVVLTLLPDLTDSYAIGTPGSAIVSVLDNDSGAGATVSGVVWDDDDWNGIRDAGEIGMGGQQVLLCDGTPGTGGMVIVAMTVTDAAGVYQLSAPAAGTYYVAFAVAEDHVLSPANQGSDTTDSDAESLSPDDFGCTAAFALGAGQAKENVDAGQGQFNVTIEYLPTGQGTTGDLSLDNPNGGTGPAFGGGYRFFPDAVNFDSRLTSRNVVRIRATLDKPKAGVMVHFRAFDVDDPSNDGTIDTNGVSGRDNRGSVGGATSNWPGAQLAANGYLGRLRPVDGAFAGEGAIVSVATTVNAQNVAIAEVELATSFNPGDNFRVVASVNRTKLQALNDTTSVPTTGVIAGFTGAVTQQLSVWRRFHVEQDRMGAIPFGQRQTGQIAVVFPLGVFAVEKASVILNFQIPVANRFVGGTLRDSNGNWFPILSHTNANPSTVVVQTPLGIAPIAGNVSLTQGDFQVGSIIGEFTPAGGQLEFTTDIRIANENEYENGLLRVAGRNYRILSNTEGPNAKVTIIPGTAIIPWGPVEIYQDDYAGEDFSTQAPVPHITTPTDANFYDMLQVSTERALNRYADAYMVAEFEALNAFDSNNVTPVGHAPTLDGEELFNLVNVYRGTSPGGPARDANYETDVFWAVYVLAAYEPAFSQDMDPTSEGAVMGAAEAHKNQISAVFTETIRDATSTFPILTEANARSRTTVHEIGHQFDVADVPGEHRDLPPNIMSSSTSGVPENQFYFHPADIVALRKRVKPPGT